MTKFSSIWGDLEVGSVTPASPPDDGKKKPEEEEEVQTTKTETEEEEEETEESAASGSESGEGSEEEEGSKEKPKDSDKGKGAEDTYEFTDDDVSKAYDILRTEGVLELNDDDLEEIENTPQGIADAVAITVRNKMEKEFSAIPQEVRQFYEHMMQGKDPAEFQVQKAFSWEEADISDDNVKKSALKQLYLDQGMTEQDAEDEVEDVVGSDKYDLKAERAIEVLAKKEAKLKEAQAEQRRKEEKKVQEEQAREIKQIESLIDSADEMAGFKMTDKRKKGFKDYLFKINPRTGKTQMQENMSSEDRKLKIAFLDYVSYTKADLEKEVKNEVTKERKKKLSSYTDKNVSSTNSSRSVEPQKKGSKGSIKFPSIFGTQKIELED